MRRMGKLSILIVCVLAGLHPIAEAAVEPAPAEGAARDTDLLQGLSDLHQGMFNRGQVRFRTFLQAHPTDPHGHLFLAFCEWWKLLQAGSEARSATMEYHLEEALRLAQDQLNGSPEDATALTSLGTAYIFIAQYRAAEKKVFKAASAARKGKAYLEKAARLDPDLVDSRFGLGAYNYYADKVSVLAKGLRGMLFLPGGDSEKGLAQLREVAEHGRYFRTEAHLLLAIIYQGKHEQRFHSALDELGAALELNPDSPIILGSMGELLMRLGNYPESHAALQRAITRCGASSDPDQEEMGHLLEVLLADSLELSLHGEESLAKLRVSVKGATLPPEWRTRALNVAARAALRTGDEDSLKVIYGALAATDEEETSLHKRFGNPAWNDPSLSRALAPILGSMDGSPEAALPQIERLLSSHPDCPELIFHRARISFHLRQWSEASSWLQKIPDIQAQTAPWVLGWKALFLGRIRWLQGQRQEATASYRRALAVDGFRGKDLARELLGPEAEKAQAWPGEIFKLGLQPPKDARHVAARFGVGWDAAISIHHVLAGIVGGERQGGVVIAGQEKLQIAHAPFQVLPGIEDVLDLVVAGRVGHQLHQPHGSPS